METIHVKFDELIAMDFKHDSLEPVFQRFINDDSPVDSMNIPPKEDLDNLFGLYMKNTLRREQTSQISLNEADESNQEDSADFDGNTVFVPYNVPIFEEDESSTTALDPSNMHEFHQVQPSTHIWTKDHSLEQVIGNPSRTVMIQQSLQTDYEVCMYALTVITLKPKNIKESMSGHKWIESMQDELHQFERLDVWELVPRPDGKNIIAVKWI
nr:hypothetical protein [Tanacetum cinerariifolium]